LKKEMQGLHEDQSAAEAASPSGATAASDPVPPPAAIAAPAPPDQQAAQIDVLQQQIRDLQRAATLDPADLPGVPTEPQRTQQAG
jgi:hypothetical protein